jgi:hypothetical protein
VRHLDPLASADAAQPIMENETIVAVLGACRHDGHRRLTARTVSPGYKEFLRGRARAVLGPASINSGDGFDSACLRHGNPLVGGSTTGLSATSA